MSWYKWEFFYKETAIIQCFQKFSGELKSKNLSGKDICLKMTSNNYEEKQFILCDINSNKGILYIKKGTNWIKNSNKIVNVPSSSKKIRTRGFNLPSESLLNNIDLEEIIESFSDRVLDTLGLERDDFSKENYNSLMAGIIYAVDQNIMFGAVSFVTGAREDDDNYFFMLGKTSCDIFCIGLFVKSGATLSASAASSFTLGGGLAALGLATSETGLGFIVGEGGAATLATAGTIELLGATTLSFMATRSSDILIKDRQKFAKIERKVVEETGNLDKTNKSFWKAYDKLPKDIQKKADKAFELYKKNPDHPGLNFEKLSGGKFYSVRVDGKYRAYGRKLVDGGIEWLEINGHDYKTALRMLENMK